MGAIYKTPLKPLSTWLIRNTFYRQFCGGENFNQLSQTLASLHDLKIGAILDYAAETSKHDLWSEQSANGVLKILNETLDLASHVKYSGTSLAVKVTPFFPYETLLNGSKFLVEHQADIWNVDRIELNQFAGFEFGLESLRSLLSRCKAKNVSVLLDAERIETQPLIDWVALYMMREFNNTDIIVQNTYQMYLEGSLQRLNNHFLHSLKTDFGFGMKLVRGAYIHSDKMQSLAKKYGPIWSTLRETHLNYDSAISHIINTLMIKYENRLKLTVASHNKDSVMIAADMVLKRECLHDKVAFAQLYGMYDVMTNSLVARGLNTYKYLPFGPVHLTMPYLIRRAQENSDIFRSDAELNHLKLELLSRIGFNYSTEKL